MKKTASELAVLFNSYPGVDEFHTTSDGLSFPEKHNAEGHARTLDNKEVVTVLRVEVEASPNSPEGDEASPSPAKGEEEAIPSIDEGEEVKVAAENAPKPAAKKKATGK